MVPRVRVLAALVVSLGLATVAVAVAIQLSDASTEELRTQRFVEAAALGFVMGLLIVLIFGEARKGGSRDGRLAGAALAAYYVLLVLAAVLIFRLTAPAGYDLSTAAITTGLLGVALTTAGLWLYTGERR